ncbi:DsbA family protein [Marinivivus vitaminiproducens]|uniref:DsbA family protein n=1 Tax=Marinivivus vitaminiproducens TaxID=3035935 RepID=UPI0027A0A93A|nr:DsbA family protein [Geminicoccaceae bacterium SCSIO 64248]
MKRIAAFVLPLGLMLAACLGFAGSGRDALAQADEPGEYVLGDPSAPVTIIEYASLTCPHCAHFHTQTLPELKKRYIDTGKVRLEMHDFPLDRVALQAAVIAHCGGPERYPGFIDVLFRSQERWATAPDPVVALTQIARMGGLQPEDVNACLADEALTNRILQSRLDAQEEYDISSTPSFVIDGEVHAGDQGVEGFTQLLDPLVN